MTVANGDDDVAGKTETKPESEFEHLSHSGNTQDLKAADPYVTSKMEGLHARHLHENPDGEETFGTSVMKSDYRPGKRSVAVFFLQLLPSSCYFHSPLFPLHAMVPYAQRSVVFFISPPFPSTSASSSNLFI